MAGTNAALRDRLLDSPIVPIPVPTTTTDVQLVSRPCLLCGWAFEETTASAVARMQLIGADSGSVPVVIPVRLASGASDHENIADEGVLMEAGLSLHVVSGSVQGSVWVRV